jgi:hypothetical protein
MRSDQRRYQSSLRQPARFFKGCQGKKRHASKHAAMGILRSMLYRAYDGEIPEQFIGWSKEEYVAYVKGLEPYHCPFCKSWHLGHSNKETVIR